MRISARAQRTTAIAVVLGGLIAAAPATADCVRATATYTNASGSSTTVGRTCVVSTPWNETYSRTERVWATGAGSVTVSVGVPLP